VKWYKRDFLYLNPQLLVLLGTFFDLLGIKSLFYINNYIKKNITNCKWVFVPMGSSTFCSSCILTVLLGMEMVSFCVNLMFLWSTICPSFSLCHWSLTIPRFFAVVCCTNTLKAEQRTKWTGKKIIVMNILVHSICEGGVKLVVQLYFRCP